MSISYYGLPVRDPALVGPIVEGTDTTYAIDAAKVRAAVQRSIPGGSSGTLRWESGNDYVSVGVYSSHAVVTHNAGDDPYGEQAETVLLVLEALHRAGLHVYDPRLGDWFF